MADYTLADLRRVLDETGIERGDTVYCHSNIGVFGRPEGIGSSHELAQMYLDAITDAIGPTGTLIVPTYTYSFCRKQTFDPATTPSAMGLLAEWVRTRPGAVRSADPCFSVALLGRDPDRFCHDLPANSFAPGSTFDRFTAENGKMLCLNHPGCTLLHYVERQLAVPYRFDKPFTGTMTVNGNSRTLDWEIFVRYLSDDRLEHDPHPFVDLIKSTGMARWRPLGRGEALTITARQVFDSVAQALPNAPWLLTEAHAAGHIPVIDSSQR